MRVQKYNFFEYQRKKSEKNIFIDIVSQFLLIFAI